MNETTVKTWFETCVLCGQLTDVPVNRPVSERPTYVEGAGQLCRKCYAELYHTEDLRARQHC